MPALRNPCDCCLRAPVTPCFGWLGWSLNRWRIFPRTLHPTSAADACGQSFGSGGSFVECEDHRTSPKAQLTSLASVASICSDSMMNTRSYNRRRHRHDRERARVFVACYIPLFFLFFSAVRDKPRLMAGAGEPGVFRRTRTTLASKLDCAMVGSYVLANSSALTVHTSAHNPTVSPTAVASDTFVLPCSRRGQQRTKAEAASAYFHQPQRRRSSADAAGLRHSARDDRSAAPSRARPKPTTRKTPTSEKEPRMPPVLLLFLRCREPASSRFGRSRCFRLGRGVVGAGSGCRGEHGRGEQQREEEVSTWESVGAGDGVDRVWRRFILTRKEGECHNLTVEQRQL